MITHKLVVEFNDTERRYRIADRLPEWMFYKNMSDHEILAYVQLLFEDAPTNLVLELKRRNYNGRLIG